MATATEAAVELENLKALPSTRAEALAIGAISYFSGEPCAKGHVAARNVKSNMCVECRRQRHAAWIAENPDRVAGYREKFKSRVSAYMRERRAKNPEFYNAKTQVWREKNKDHLRAYDHAKYRDDIEKSRAESRAYYHRNSATMREQSRQWHANNREKATELTRAWYVANPGKEAEFRQRRRARLHGAEGSFTADDIAAIRAIQKERCACCKKKKALAIDHIQAISRGGSNNPSNLQLLCKSCNSSKRDRDAIEFMQSKGFLL